MDTKKYNVPLNFKIHIYDFDKTITSNPLYYNNDESTVKQHINIHQSFITKELHITFGGDERIELLRKYFRLLKTKGVELYIVSFNKSSLIKKSLDLLGISQYFTNIYGIDNTVMGSTVSKFGTIKKIVDKHQLSIYNYLFVDDDKNNIKELATLVSTYYVNTGTGINIDHMLTIISASI